MASIQATPDELGTVEIEEVEPTEETEGDSTDETQNARESVRQTVERAFKAEKEKTDLRDSGGQKSASAIDPANQASPNQKNKAAKAQKTAEVDATPGAPIQAPQRLNAVEREAFASADPALQKAIGRMFADHEKQFTKTQQEYSRAAADARGYMEAVQPYLQAFGQAGFSGPAGMAQLCAAQARLTNQQTSVQAFSELGRDLYGQNLQAVLQHILGGGAGQAQQQSADISQHPQFRAVQAEQSTLRSHIEQQHLQQAVQPIVSEMENARYEKDAAGNFLFPELHDDEFLEATKPLVSAYVGTIPGMTYGQALKRAWSDLSGKSAPAITNGQNQAGYQSPTPQQQRGVNAAVSVRGKIAPLATSGSGSDDGPPPEALKNPRATAMWALNHLRRNGA